MIAFHMVLQFRIEKISEREETWRRYLRERRLVPIKLNTKIQIAANANRFGLPRSTKLSKIDP